MQTKLRFVSQDEEHIKYIQKALLFSRNLHSLLNTLHNLCFQDLKTIKEKLYTLVNNLQREIRFEFTGNKEKDFLGFVNLISDTWFSYWLIYDSISQGNIAARVIYEMEKRGIDYEILKDTWEGDYLVNRDEKLLEEEPLKEWIKENIMERKVVKTNHPDFSFITDLSKKLRTYHTSIYGKILKIHEEMHRRYGVDKWFDSYLDYLIVEKLGSVPDYMLFGEMAHGKEFSGKVRVIEEPGKVEDEYDIILIHSADPDYLPYVTRCKGMIVERGGVLSHTAILARELNIPCVVGVSNASFVIKDGDFVKVINGGVYVWKRKDF